MLVKCHDGLSSFTLRCTLYVHRYVSAIQNCMRPSPAPSVVIWCNRPGRNCYLDQQKSCHSLSPTVSVTPSCTPTDTATATATVTITSTVTRSRTATGTGTITRTNTRTASNSPSPSFIPTSPIHQLGLSQPEAAGVGLGVTVFVCFVCAGIWYRGQRAKDARRDARRREKQLRKTDKHVVTSPKIIPQSPMLRLTAPVGFSSIEAQPAGSTGSAGGGDAPVSPHSGNGPGSTAPPRRKQSYFVPSATQRVKSDGGNSQDGDDDGMRRPSTQAAGDHWDIEIGLDDDDDDGTGRPSRARSGSVAPARDRSVSSPSLSTRKGSSSRAVTPQSPVPASSSTKARKQSSPSLPRTPSSAAASGQGRDRAGSIRSPLAREVDASLGSPTVATATARKGSVSKKVTIQATASGLYKYPAERQPKAMDIV